MCPSDGHSLLAWQCKSLCRIFFLHFFFAWFCFQSPSLAWFVFVFPHPLSIFNGLSQGSLGQLCYTSITGKKLWKLDNNYANKRLTPIWLCLDAASGDLRNPDWNSQLIYDLWYFRNSRIQSISIALSVIHALFSIKSTSIHRLIQLNFVHPHLLCNNYPLTQLL